MCTYPETYKLLWNLYSFAETQDSLWKNMCIIRFCSKARPYQTRVQSRSNQYREYCYKLSVFYPKRYILHTQFWNIRCFEQNMQTSRYVTWALQIAVCRLLTSSFLKTKAPKCGATRWNGDETLVYVIRNFVIFRCMKIWNTWWNLISSIVAKDSGKSVVYTESSTNLNLCGGKGGGRPFPPQDVEKN